MTFLADHTWALPHPCLTVPTLISQSHIPDASLALVWSWEDEEEAVRAQKESVGQDSVGLRVG